MGKLFAIASGKGGTGKSTVAAGIGAALARKGRRVLLIDTDEGLRCLDLILGVADKTVFDAGDLVNGFCDASAAVYPVPSCDGLFLLAAPTSQGQLSDREVFCSLCEKLASVFDYVFLDCPAGIDTGFINACQCVSNVLVVINTDPASLRAAAVVNSLLEKYGVSHRRLLLNKFTSDSVISGDSPNIDAIIDSTGIQLIGIVPFDVNIASYAASGKAVDFGGAAASFDRIAKRLEGESVPLRIDGKLFE